MERSCKGVGGGWMRVASIKGTAGAILVTSITIPERIFKLGTIVKLLTVSQKLSFPMKLYSI
jgi:hypothetical protein